MKTSNKRTFFIQLAIFFIIGISGISYSYTQPVINYGIYPLVGESYNLKRFEATAFDPNLAGANVTWDYADADFPEDAYSGDGSIAEAVNLDATFCDLSEILTGNIGYFYEDIDALSYFVKTYNTDKISEEGFKSCMTEYGRLNIYTNPKDYLLFPMEYGDSFSDSFSALTEGYSPFDTSYGSFTGDITVEYDGYGTLILPFITIPNVMRIKTHQVIDYLPSGTFTITDGWYWYNTATKGEIFGYVELFNSDGPDSETFILNQNINQLTSIEMPTSIPEIDVFPNPNTGSFNVHFSENTDRLIQINVFDITGRLIYHSSVYTSNNTTQVSLPDNFSGLAVLTVNDGVSVKSVEISVVK
ncbi:MAG: T9SS type A sorting domain-containing protein [Bacteroidetes bacterium]|jgi:hypothetical protein|nr:T9SS type A sorting domain-containing protein [Bacteroidota bacterium]